MSNKATLDRLHHALNSGDPALVSTTVDEIFHPDVRIGTPPPIDASGAQALKQVWTTLLRAYPDLHVSVQDLFGEEDRSAGCWGGIPYAARMVRICAGSPLRSSDEPARWARR